MSEIICPHCGMHAGWSSEPEASPEGDEHLYKIAANAQKLDKRPLLDRLREATKTSHYSLYAEAYCALKEKGMTSHDDKELTSAQGLLRWRGAFTFPKDEDDEPSPSPAIGDQELPTDPAELLKLADAHGWLYDDHSMGRALTDALRTAIGDDWETVSVEDIEAARNRWRDRYVTLAAENERLTAIDRIHNDQMGELERERDALAAEATDAKATLAGQSARVIDLELAVDRLAAENERLQERIRFADQDFAAECAGLRGEIARLQQALKEQKT